MDTCSCQRFWYKGYTDIQRRKKMTDQTGKTLKEKLKTGVDAISGLLKHGIQGELKKTKKKFGSQTKMGDYSKKRPQGGWKD